MTNTPKTVYIFGAGASADAGAPVMYDFLDRAESLLSGRSVDDERESFELVFDGIHRLQGVYAKSQLDTENLEAVFAAFEMAALIGRIGDCRDNVARYAAALRRVI